MQAGVPFTMHLLNGVCLLFIIAMKGRLLPWKILSHSSPITVKPTEEPFCIRRNHQSYRFLSRSIFFSICICNKTSAAVLIFLHTWGIFQENCTLNSSSISYFYIHLKLKKHFTDIILIKRLASMTRNDTLRHIDRLWENMIQRLHIPA